MLRLLRALGDVVKGIFLGSDGLGFFQRGAEHVRHVGVLRVVNYQVEDLFVADNVECPHENHERNILLDHRDRAHNCLATAALLCLVAELDAELLGWTA